jgi:hypothetical protein
MKGIQIDLVNGCSCNGLSKETASKAAEVLGCRRSMYISHYPCSSDRNHVQQRLIVNAVGTELDISFRAFRRAWPDLPKP